MIIEIINDQYAGEYLERTKNSAICLSEHLDELKLLDNSLDDGATRSVVRIVCDCAEAPDEFHLYEVDKELNTFVEVTSRDIAEQNDKSYLEGCDEFANAGDVYKIGGYWSNYRLLGEYEGEEYWFRLM